MHAWASEKTILNWVNGRLVFSVHCRTICSTACLPPCIHWPQYQSSDQQPGHRTNRTTAMRCSYSTFPCNAIPLYRSRTAFVYETNTHHLTWHVWNMDVWWHCTGKQDYNACIPVKTNTLSVHHEYSILPPWRMHTSLKPPLRWIWKVCSLTDGFSKFGWPVDARSRAHIRSRGFTWLLCFTTWVMGSQAWHPFTGPTC